MTLNDVIALILHYFTEFVSFALQADYITVVEGRPIMLAKYRLAVILAKTDPHSSRIVSLQQLSLLYMRVKDRS